MSIFMLRWYADSERIVKHCETVAKVAANISRLAVQCGWPVDTHLIEAAALLHDITKNRGNNHAKTGGALLARLGCSKVGRVVAAHTDLPPDALTHPDERAVVYLADKLVKNDASVGVERHFAGTLEKYAHDQAATAAVRQRLDNARAVMAMLGMTDADCFHIMEP
jgi:putative nucleotidyltransferase with HDIG domain